MTVMKCNEKVAQKCRYATRHRFYQRFYDWL